MFSNKIDVAFNAHGATVVASKPYTYNKKGDFVEEPEYYGSISKAVSSYLGTGT